MQDADTPSVDTPSVDAPTPLERAWSEYLAWTRGSDPEQYEETEQRAWKRLEDVRLASLIAAPAEFPR